MKVFLSWSEGTSRKVALILRDFLRPMLSQIQPFMSEHDVAAGAHWPKKLTEELQNTDYGIICLTRSCMEKPWVLFEAGALSKHDGAGVCCLLLDLTISDVTGPLKNFQNVAWSENGFQKLLSTLNQRCENPLTSSELKIVLDNNWPHVKERVGAVLNEPDIEPDDRFPASTSYLIPYSDDAREAHYELAHRRLASAGKGELVRQIAITGKAILARSVGAAGDKYFFGNALRIGITYHGLLVNPNSDWAQFRAQIETPGSREGASLLDRDSAEVINWYSRGYEQFGLTEEEMARVSLRYSSVAPGFSLWLFEDVAFVEPFHFGRIDPDIPHLCGFSQICVPLGTNDFELLTAHFDTLWHHAQPISAGDRS